MMRESVKHLDEIVSDRLALYLLECSFQEVPSITRQRTVTVSIPQDRGVTPKTSYRVNSMHLQVFVKEFLGAYKTRVPEGDDS
jgi:hypothetical protein